MNPISISGVSNGVAGIDVPGSAVSVFGAVADSVTTGISVEDAVGSMVGSSVPVGGTEGSGVSEESTVGLVVGAVSVSVGGISVAVGSAVSVGGTGVAVGSIGSVEVGASVEMTAGVPVDSSGVGVSDANTSAGAGLAVAACVCIKLSPVRVACGVSGPCAVARSLQVNETIQVKAKTKQKTTSTRRLECIFPLCEKTQSKRGVSAEPAEDAGNYLSKSNILFMISRSKLVKIGCKFER